MEELFSTPIAINNEQVNYHVSFDHEQYIFHSGSDKAFPEFSFRREHDEWHDQQNLPEEIKKQAVDALERYLLKQH